MTRLSSKSDNSHLPVRNSIFDSIDAQQIGEGKYFTEGKFGHGRNLGLKGQLSKIKRRGKLVVKNLSQKNLGDIYGIVANRLKKHDRGYGVHISRKDKINIMNDAEKLVRTKGSNFSREDKDDLEKIVDSLKEQGQKNILKNRYTPKTSKIQKGSLFRNKRRKMVIDEDSHSNNLSQSFTVPKSNYQSKNKKDVNFSKKENEYGSSPEGMIADLEEDLNNSSLEQNDELEGLRKQAKDLPI